jgi:hypothetical protein
VAPSEVLDRVESVTYHLDPAYPDPVRTVHDRGTGFKLKELANGTSIVTAEVRIRGQASPIWLNRFIDLRPTGPGSDAPVRGANAQRSPLQHGFPMPIVGTHRIRER